MAPEGTEQQEAPPGEVESTQAQDKKAQDSCAESCGQVDQGRIVRYVLKEGEVRSAIVVKVWGDGHENGCCNLHVFLDAPDIFAGDPNTLLRTSVTYSAEPVVGTWHWPRRQ